MPLSWNEIKTRALAFSKQWEDAHYEDGQAKPFLIDFFEVFGITNKRIASFEHNVKKYDYKDASSDAACVAFLFKRYYQITSLLPTEIPNAPPLENTGRRCM